MSSGHRGVVRLLLLRARPVQRVRDCAGDNDAAGNSRNDETGVAAAAVVATAAAAVRVHRPQVAAVRVALRVDEGAERCVHEARSIVGQPGARQIRDGVLVAAVHVERAVARHLPQLDGRPDHDVVGGGRRRRAVELVAHDALRRRDGRLAGGRGGDVGDVRDAARAHDAQRARGQPEHARVVRDGAPARGGAGEERRGDRGVAAGARDEEQALRVARHAGGRRDDAVQAVRRNVEREDLQAEGALREVGVAAQEHAEDCVAHLDVADGVDGVHVVAAHRDEGRDDARGARPRVRHRRRVADGRHAVRVHLHARRDARHAGVDGDGQARHDDVTAVVVKEDERAVDLRIRARARRSVHRRQLRARLGVQHRDLGVVGLAAAQRHEHAAVERARGRHAVLVAAVRKHAVERLRPPNLETRRRIDADDRLLADVPAVGRQVREVRLLAHHHHAVASVQ
mmetsp:Transcript_14513/g.50527  ORF Transcript_14513/g.50527 Transcript_14513/m.50527 type:complete len:456 (-) Transcript_14513:259-1626(-)